MYVCLGVDISILVLCYASGITDYDWRTPELSNAPLQMKQNTTSKKRNTSVNLNLNLNLNVRTCIAKRPLWTLSTKYRVHLSASITRVVRCVIVKIREFTPHSPCIARMISSNERNLSRELSAVRKTFAFCR